MNILFQNRAFGRFVAGQFASVLGDGLYLIAMVWWVKSTTGSDAKVALLSLCAVIPTVLFGILGGALTDRTSPKRLMISMDLLRAALLIMLAALVWTGQLHFELLCLFTVLLSTASAFFRPGLGVTVVDLVPREQLPMANGGSQTTLALAGLAGPALGGLTMAYAGLLPAILVNAVTFLLSAAFLKSLPRSEAPQASSGKHLGQDVAAGFRYLVSQPSILLMLLAFCVVNFVIAPLPVMLPSLSKDVLHSGVTGYGWLEALVTAGGVLGGLLAGLIKPRQITRLVSLQLLLAGVCLYSLGHTTLFHWAAVLMVCVGTGFAMSSTLVGVFLQLEVPREYLGRVFGVVGAVTLALRPLALALLLPVLQFVTPQRVFTYAGLVLAASAALLLIGQAWIQRRPRTLAAQSVPTLEGAD